MQVARILGRYPFKHANTYLLVETGEVVGGEGRPQRRHLIEHASQRPHVALRSVGLVFPYFGTGVIGCAGLCGREILLENFGDVEISQFELLVRRDEDVGAFEVAM
jgi:hypothetical protein